MPGSGKWSGGNTWATWPRARSTSNRESHCRTRAWCRCSGNFRIWWRNGRLPPWFAISCCTGFRWWSRCRCVRWAWPRCADKGTWTRSSPSSNPWSGCRSCWAWGWSCRTCPDRCSRRCGSRSSSSAISVAARTTSIPGTPPAKSRCSAAATAKTIASGSGSSARRTSISCTSSTSTASTSRWLAAECTPAAGPKGCSFCNPKRESIARTPGSAKGSAIGTISRASTPFGSPSDSACFAFAAGNRYSSVASPSLSAAVSAFPAVPLWFRPAWWLWWYAASCAPYFFRGTSLSGCFLLAASGRCPSAPLRW